MKVVDWPRLFEAIGVVYYTKGPNTSKGNITIKCPWCGPRDASHHLAISLNFPAYRCFINNNHSGGNLYQLLLKLGVPAKRAVALLNTHIIESNYVPETTVQDSNLDTEWKKFSPAEVSDEILNYLYARRKFSDPESVCRNYDLRYAPAGAWACRVLFPFKDEGVVKAWSGRDITDRYPPKYLAKTGSLGLYAPSLAGRGMIIHEGPMDALKTTVAMHGRGAYAVAFCGLSLDSNKILFIKKQAPRIIWLCLDSNVGASQVYKLATELQNLTKISVCRLKLPPKVKDAAELGEDDVRAWLEQIERSWGYAAKEDVVQSA